MLKMVQAAVSMALMGFLATGCGGGGAEDPADPGGGSAFTPADALVMTVGQLDAATYYVTYVDDTVSPAQTVQETWRFGPASGRSFAVEVTLEGFVGTTLSSSEVHSGTATLAADGRSVGVTAPGAAFTLYMVQDLGGGIITMLTADASASWDDTWYASPPPGWITTSAPLAFSAAMFDGTTYYVSWVDDTVVPNETNQETWVFGAATGGVSTVDVTLTVYSSGAPAIQTMSATATLAADGSSLVVSGVGGSATFTLLADNGDGSYVFQGTDGVDTWNDTWFTAPPAGWLP